MSETVLARLARTDEAAVRLDGASAVVLSGVVSPDRCCRILDTARQLLPSDLRSFGHYESLPNGSTLLCRIERVGDFIADAKLLSPELVPIASELLRDRTDLLKDKLNLKWPGGAGYRCHQDASAYGRFAPVVTFGVALTPSDSTSGTLWFAPDVTWELPRDDTGCVPDDVQRGISFVPATLDTGDVAVFTGFAPHYSEENRANEPRALLLLTFARTPPGKAGRLREEYYGWRAVEVQGLSTISDFKGELTPPPD